VIPDFEFEVLHLHLSVSGELCFQTLGAIMLEESLVLRPWERLPARQAFMKAIVPVQWV
jgi:hypothetical protein